MRDFLEKRPFYKQSYDEIILQLSRLYNLVRTRGAPVTGDSSAGGSQSAFVRQTTKYWVRQSRSDLYSLDDVFADDAGGETAGSPGQLRPAQARHLEASAHPWSVPMGILQLIPE